MSKVAFAGNASGTGTFTITSPNSNTDRTVAIPDASGTIQLIGQPVTATTGNFSGDVTFGNSVLTTPAGSAPSYTCRAWVNFNGTGTVAIRASGNVSSITDNGVGDYTVNFTTAMPNADYCVQLAAKYGSAGSMAGAYSMGTMEVARTSTAMQVGSVRVWGSYTTDTTLYDREAVHVAIFR